MIDKNQVQTLRFRDEIIDISLLEEKYNHKLPPIYRSFLSVFSGALGSNRLFSKKYGVTASFISFIYTDVKKEECTDDDDRLGFIEFKSPEILFEDAANEGWELDTIYIAIHSHGGGLNVGIREHNLDIIYLEENKLANNIFEFLHMLIPVVEGEAFPNLDLNKISKKYSKKEWEEV